MSFDEKNPLYLHDIDVKQEDYFLGFFLVGAYQEVLGMRHNLFEKPTEVTVNIDKNSYSLENLRTSSSIYDTLNSLGYDVKSLENRLKKSINNSKDFEKLDELLKDNSYLRTFINQDDR